MTDSDFGQTFVGGGRMRPEALFGMGLQKRIMRAGPLAIELEADLFSHIADQQQGGPHNQTTPYADLPLTKLWRSDSGTRSMSLGPALAQFKRR